MTNRELDQMICNAFTEATPDVLGSILADCKKQQKNAIIFTSNMSNWNMKFAYTAAAAILVICLSIGLGPRLPGVNPTNPTEPFQTGTEPTVTEPTVTDPVPTDPQPTDPEPTDPEPTDPEPTDPLPTEPEPTEPKPTEPITPDGFPADLNMDVNVVRDFQDMFGYMTWSAQALGQYYDDPRDLVLRNFFYGVQFEDEAAITDDERAAIVAMTEIDDYFWMDGARFPVEKMNQLLNEMFGISLDDMNDRAFSSMHYLESTDSYYYFSGGSKTADLVSVVGTRTLENGNIEVYYLIGQPDSMDRDRAVVTLKPNGDGYQFLSNKLL